MTEYFWYFIINILFIYFSIVFMTEFFTKI